ncbi:hypothetical protein GCM10010339_71620 [Streptomyces alanosinicus]|uniref:Uncharacterized protein n=1 Tax=Streptomyces alanosinicus TaxID=68171 RepID=A0A918YP90_9ACTN|nr:hypothetical protein GCM10010339_71620 [Streptomyces alanosinicus]
MTLDSFRYSLAAQEAGTDQVEGIAGVEVGTRLAARLSSVAAAHRHPAAGFTAGVVVPQHFTRGHVVGRCVSCEIDRVSAPAYGCDLFEPARVSGFVNETDKVPLGRRKKAQTLRLIEDRAPRLI